MTWNLTPKREEMLLRAIAIDDEDYVANAIANGLDPNAAIFDGGQKIPLVCRAAAIFRGRVLQQLLQAGADPNLSAPDFDPPLFWATRIIPARLLLRAGADPSARSRAGKFADDTKLEVGDTTAFARLRRRPSLTSPLAHQGFVEFAASKAISISGDFDVPLDKLPEWFCQEFAMLDYFAEPWLDRHGEDPTATMWCALHATQAMQNSSSHLWFRTHQSYHELVTEYKARREQGALRAHVPEPTEELPGPWRPGGGPLRV